MLHMSLRVSQSGFLGLIAGSSKDKITTLIFRNTHKIMVHCWLTDTGILTACWGSFPPAIEHRSDGIHALRLIVTESVLDRFLLKLIFTPWSLQFFSRSRVKGLVLFFIGLSTRVTVAGIRQWNIYTPVTRISRLNPSSPTTDCGWCSRHMNPIILADIFWFHSVLLLLQ